MLYLTGVGTVLTETTTLYVKSLLIFNPAWLKEINLLLLFFSFMSLPLMAQERTCDLSIRVIEPLGGAVIPFGDTAYLRVSIINNDPDALMPEDSN